MWDSTKGYRGEGPPIQTNQQKGDETWKHTLEQWTEEDTNIQNRIQDTTTIGHNVWKTMPNPTWQQMKGRIVSLNMQGWGASMERRLLWQQLAQMKALVVILIDHRRNQTQLRNLETEATLNWVGDAAKWLCLNGNTYQHIQLEWEESQLEYTQH